MPLSERQRRFVRNIYSLISSGELNSDEDTKRILQTAEESDPEFVGSLRQAWSEEKGPKVEDAGFWSEFRRGVARPGELKQELDAASAIPGLDARRYTDSPSYSPGESGAMGVATGVLDAVPVLGRFVRTPREAAPAPNNAAARLGFAGTAAEATADVAPALVENLALILGTGGAAGALGASPAIASTLGLAAGSALTGGLPVDPEAERNVQNIARTGIDVVTGKIGGAAVERALGSKALKDIGLSRLLGAAGADAAIGAASAPLSVGADTASLKRNLNEMTPEERQQYAQIGPVSVRKPTVEEMALQAAFPTAELVGRVRARQAARAAGVRASLAADAASPGIDPFAETKAAAAKQDASRRIAEEAKSQQDAAREQAVRTPDWYARLTPEAARAELRDASDKGDSTRIETLLREAVAGPVLLRFGDGSEILGAVDGGEFVSQSGERAPLRSVADYVTFDDLERKRVEREASDLATRQIQRSDPLDIATAPTAENIPLPTQTDIPVPPDAQLALGDLTQQGQVEKPNPLEREFEKRVEQRGIVEGQRNQLLANPDPEVRRDTQVDLPIEWTQESARGRQSAAPMLEQSAQLDKPIEIAQEGKRGLRAAQKMLKQAATSKGVIQPNAGPTVPTATPKGGDLFGKEGRPQGRQEVLTDTISGATGPADTGAPPTPVVFGNQSEQLARAAQRRAPIPVVSRGAERTMNVQGHGPQTGHYELVSLDDMVPSHDPTTFGPDSRRRIQNTNDYTRSDFMAQTMAGAKTLDPNQILIPGVYHEGGVPWVYPDGEVANGNGRTLMIKLARMIAPEKYAAFMDAQRKAAAQFGIDPALVKDGTQIVFKVDTTPEKEVGLIQALNVPHNKQSSVEDFGLGLSRVLKPEHFAELNLSDESTLRSELQENGPRVIRGLIEKGVLSDKQATSLFKDDKGTKLNDQGLNMLESIVTGMAYDSPELRALIDSGGGKVRQVAERLLVPVANTKLAVANGNLPEVADLSKRMERVFRRVIDTGTGKKGVGGEEQSFLAGDEAPPDVVDEALVKLVTTAMTEKGGIGRLGPEVRKLGTMLEPYRTDAGQGDLVGGNELTGDVLAGMINRVERGLRLGPSMDRMDSFVESLKADVAARAQQVAKARGANREIRIAQLEEARGLLESGKQALKEVKADLDGDEIPARPQGVDNEVIDEYKRQFERGNPFSSAAILEGVERARGSNDPGTAGQGGPGTESGGAGRAAAPDDAAGSLDAGAGRADQPGDDGQSELAFKPRGPSDEEWFAGSKVVGQDGRPLEVYHGSPTGGLKGLADKSGDGIFFVDNKDVAEGYTLNRGMWRSPSETGTVYPANLSIKNPLVIDAAGKRADNIPVPWAQWKAKVFGRMPKDAVSVRAAAKYARENGYDGLIVKNVVDTADVSDTRKGTVYAVFSPDQVRMKSPDAGAVSEGPLTADNFRSIASSKRGDVVLFRGEPENAPQLTGKDADEAAEGFDYGPGIYWTDDAYQAQHFSYREKWDDFSRVVMGKASGKFLHLDRLDPGPLVKQIVEAAGGVYDHERAKVWANTRKGIYGYMNHAVGGKAKLAETLKRLGFDGVVSPYGISGTSEAARQVVVFNDKAVQRRPFDWQGIEAFRAEGSNTDRSFAPRVKEPGVVYQEYDAFDGVTKTIRLGDVVKMPNGDFVKVSRETDPGTLVGAQVVFDKPTLFDGQSDMFADQPVEEGRGPTGKTGAAREQLHEIDLFGNEAFSANQPIPSTVINKLRSMGMSEENARAIWDGRKSAEDVVDEMLMIRKSPTTAGGVVSDTLNVSERADGRGRDFDFGAAGNRLGLDKFSHATMSHVDAIQMAREQALEDIQSVLYPDDVDVDLENSRSVRQAPGDGDVTPDSRTGQKLLEKMRKKGIDPITGERPIDILSLPLEDQIDAVISEAGGSLSPSQIAKRVMDKYPRGEAPSVPQREVMNALGALESQRRVVRTRAGSYARPEGRPQTGSSERKLATSNERLRVAGAPEAAEGIDRRRADLDRQVEAYRRLAQQQDANPLPRGVDAVRAALESDKGVDERGRRFILETMEENPALFADTAVVLTDDPNLPLGAYDAKRKLVTIARAAVEGDLRTVGEELYHSLARFLPVEQQHALLGEYGQAMSRQLSHETDLRQAAGRSKNKAEWERRNSRIEFLKKAARGEAKVADASMAPDLYHLLDPDEYFADKMAEYRMVDFRRRERMSEYEKHLFGPLFKRAHEVFSAFWTKLKTVFGPESFKAYEGLKKAKAEQSPNDFIRRVRVSDPAVWERFVGQKVSDAAGMPGETALAIRAYHGTPHKFDRFTTEKIGTGEGAQAYGWGLYFTGKKDIAEWYARRLADNKKWRFFDEPVESEKDVERIAFEKFKQAGFHEDIKNEDNIKQSVDAAVYAYAMARRGYSFDQIASDYLTRYFEMPESVRNMIADSFEAATPMQDSPWLVRIKGTPRRKLSFEQQRALNDIEWRLAQRGGTWASKPGSEALADVRSEIDATMKNVEEFEARNGPVENRVDDEGYAMSDRKIYFQTVKEAKKLLDTLPIEVERAKYRRNLYTVSLGKEGGADPNLLKYDGPVTADQANSIMKMLDERDHFGIGDAENPAEQSAAEQDRAVFEDEITRGVSGRTVYTMLQEGFGGSREASLALRDIGIDGIDYPAGTMSGGMDDGTRNYVIFDDSNVNVDEAVSFKPRPMAPEIEKIVQEKGGVVPLERVGPSILERARDFIADIRQRGLLRAEVSIMDARAAIRRFEEKNFKWSPKGKGVELQGLEPGVSSWQQAMFASNASDQVATAFEAHPLKLRRYADDATGLEGSIVELDRSKDGLAKILLPAEKAGMQRHVFQFMAAERAAEELARGTNGWRPYSEEEITTMRRLGEEEIADGVKVKDVAKQAHDWFRSFLDLAEAAGTINRAARAEWERTMYIPFFKKVEKAYADGSTWDDVIGPGGAPDMVNIADVIRPIKGKNAPINDVFENMIRMAQHLTEVSMKNLAGQKFVSEVEAVPEVSDIMRPLTEQELKDNGWRLKNKEWKSQEGIVSVLYDGEPKYFKVEDDLLYRGLVATGGPANWGRAEWLRRALQMGTQMVRFGATRNPVFALKNPVRDTLNAVAVGDEKRFVPFISTLSGYKSALMGDDRTLRVRAAGASQGGYFERGAAGLSKQLRRGLERKAGTRSGPVARLVDAYDAYEHFLASGEMASRVGLAEAIRARGGTDAEQIAGAQNLINYNLHGDSKLASLFTSTIPFLNARLAGFYRLGVAASAPTAKGEALNKFWRSAVMLGMASSVLSYFNWSQNGEYYDNLEEWDKDANWHFYIPSPTGGGPLHFKLPKPFEFGTVFGTFPERMFGFASEKSTDRGDTALLKERLGAAWKDIFNLPNPVNPLSALNQMALTRPYMEQTANKNFYSGKPIVPRGEDQAEPVSQYGGRTSRTARIFAGAVDKVPGDPQMLEWMRSPRRVEEMVRGYTGGLGLYALRMMDIGLDGLDWAGVVDLPPKAPREMRDVPIAGDVMRAFFTGDAGDEDGSRYVTKFYNELDDAAEAYLTLKRYRETGDAKKAREYASEKRDQLRKYAALQGSRDAIAGLNDQVRRTQESRSMTGEQKRDRQESLLKRKRRLAQMAVLGLRNRDQGSNSTGASP